MHKKDCGCKKHNKQTIHCTSVLDGTFTDVNGVIFSASMTATGSGSDCKSAEKNSEKNIQETLENFLKEYKPKIVNETHNVTTSCDGCENPKEKNIVLDISLDSFSYVQQQNDTGLYNLYIRTESDIDKSTVFYITSKNINTSNYGKYFLGEPIMNTAYTQFQFNKFSGYVNGKKVIAKIIPSSNWPENQTYVETNPISVTKEQRDVLINTVTFPDKIKIEIYDEHGKKDVGYFTIAVTTVIKDPFFLPYEKANPVDFKAKFYITLI
jgi:hypothetical protein